MTARSFFLVEQAMVRNDLISKGIQPSMEGCRHHFKKEFALAALRAKRDLPELMDLWIHNMM